MRIRRRAEPQGARLSELHGVLPQLSLEQVRTMLRQMQRDGRARSVGMGNGARWRHEGPSGDWMGSRTLIVSLMREKPVACQGFG
jgi:hypothetical protein